MSAVLPAEETRLIEVPQESFSSRSAVPAVQQPQAASLMGALAAAAADPRTDVVKVKELYAIHKEIMDRAAETAFNEAMANAQAEIQPVATNASNSHTKSRYAKLEAIDKAITPIHTKHGLAITYDNETKNETDPIPAGWIRVVAWVLHSGGHKKRYHLDLPPDGAGKDGNSNKTMVQAIGSTNAYGRRYLKCGIFNVSTYDDNDGNNEQKGVTEVAYQGFVKKIEAATTHEKALEAWREGLAACEKIKDKETAKALREVLRKHRAFIDSANKAQ